MLYISFELFYGIKYTFYTCKELGSLTFFLNYKKDTDKRPVLTWGGLA